MLPRIHWAIFTACLLLLLPPPLIALYDRLHPWPLGTTSLEQEYSAQARVCLAMSSYTYWRNNQSLELTSRSYLLFPRVLRHPVMVTVTADQSSQTETEESWLIWLAPEVAFYAVILLVLTTKLLQVTGVLSVRLRQRPGLATS